MYIYMTSPVSIVGSVILDWLLSNGMECNVYRASTVLYYSLVLDDFRWDFLDKQGFLYAPYIVHVSRTYLVTHSEPYLPFPPVNTSSTKGAVTSLSIQQIHSVDFTWTYTVFVEQRWNGKNKQFRQEASLLSTSRLKCGRCTCEFALMVYNQSRLCHLSLTADGSLGPFLRRFGSLSDVFWSFVVQQL